MSVEDVSFDLLDQKDEGLPSDGNRNRENSNGVRTSVGTKNFFFFFLLTTEH